jgi:hypothetical protein
MQILLSRAGLVLNPGQVADLVLAWRQVAGLIATISHDRPLADDMALAFRLSPPAGAAPPAPRPAAVAKRKTAARPKAAAKRKAAPKAKAKGKSAPKRRATAKPAPRKRSRRGR